MVRPAEVLPPARHVAALRTPTPHAEGPQHAQCTGRPQRADKQDGHRPGRGSRDAQKCRSAELWRSGCRHRRSGRRPQRFKYVKLRSSCGWGRGCPRRRVAAGLGCSVPSPVREGDLIWKLHGARETPPPYHQLITCSSRSRNWNRRGTMHSLGQIELWWARADYSVHHGDGECSLVDLQQT